MDEIAKRPNGGSQNKPVPACSSPLSSPTCSSTQVWLPVESPLLPPWMDDRQTDQDQDHHVQIQSSPPSHLYEELFCSGQTSTTLGPLAGALMTSSGLQSDVVKQGYLGKLERNHRRYFVLRSGSHTGRSRLEWFRNQEKFTAMEKSAGKAALFGSSKQGVVYLSCCLGVSRIGSSRKGHLVVLYAKGQTVVLVADDQWEQQEWYQAIKKLIEDERKDEERRGGFDEEDDGYCTLPPAAFFKEVWPVSVKSRDLGCSRSLAGESRLCLTAASLILVRTGACTDLPSVTIPLLSVRRFGHLNGSFFLELGRSAPIGPGEIWMEARDQGNPAVAQHIHEAVRETVRALRVLPDFSRSPTSNHNQLPTLLASKRCRPKHRDKPVNVRPPSRNPEPQTSPTQCSLQLKSTLSCSSHLSPLTSQRSTSETGSCMEETKDTGGDDCAAACRVEGREPVEKEGEEGLGYMMMSPQVSHRSAVLPQDDYMTMASPHKYEWTAGSPQTSFNSSASDSHSPHQPSRHQTTEPSPPRWLVTSVHEAGQSQTSISCSTRPQADADQEQNPPERRPLPAHARTALCGAMAPFVTGGPGCTRPVHLSPNSGPGPSSQHQAVRRYRLSLCLPSCLQTEDRT